MNNKRNENEGVINIIKDSFFNNWGFFKRLKDSKRMYKIILEERYNKKFINWNSQLKL